MLNLREDAMTNINRRNALALGAAALSTPLVAAATPAAGKTYGATEGKELFPGVRLVALGERDSMITAYKKVAMEDVVFQPKGSIPLGDVMEHDMVCAVTEGELLIKAGDMEFTAKEGDVWSCAKASTRESAVNNGTVVAVMRVINLKAA
jgi:quercetin dioxygenase-like cupin family protein